MSEYGQGWDDGYEKAQLELDNIRAENARLREENKWLKREAEYNAISAARVAMGETDKRINPEYTVMRIGEAE